MSRRWTRARLVLCALALAACARKDAKSSPAPQADATTIPQEGDDAAAEGGGAAPEGGRATLGELEGARLPWTEAIRAERWKEAEQSIASLPEGEQRKPEVRFARAQVAARLGDHARAVALLDGLEDGLPLLRDAIARARGESAFHAGPYEKAAEHFGARGGASSWARAAQAWEKAGDPARARAACDRVLSEPKRTREHEEIAHAIRLRLAAAASADAVADARWLAVHALDPANAHAGAEVLEKLKPPKPLTSEELLARAGTLADAMRTEDALRVVERAAAAKGKATPLDLCHARAEAYYKARTRYPEAALAYRQCAALGGPKLVEDLFLVARAFSRADRDGDALPAFQTVIQRHAKTPWAEQAEFHVARTHALAGHWKDAAQAFDEYVKRFPNGRDRREADRYRALAHLAAGDHRTARKLLEDLAGGAGDSLTSARWTNLAALAALRDGDRVHAIARWSEVARSRPLTWPALVARARLTEAGAPLPLTIDPPEAGPAPDPVNVKLPPPVDLLHRIGLDAAAEDALRTREAVVLGHAGGRGTEALCAAYGQLDRGKRRYQISRQVPGALLASAPGPRNRWAWECAFPRPHRDHVRTYEATTKVPADLVWAVMRQESGFDAEVVSPARAVGLMQLLPETARAVAATAKMEHDDARLTSPAQNVALGTLYLQELIAKFGSATPLAVAAYNAGPDAITRWQSRAKGLSLDVFVEAIPFIETREYVVRVMGNLARYGYLERGEAGIPSLALELP